MRVPASRRWTRFLRISSRTDKTPTPFFLSSPKVFASFTWTWPPWLRIFTLLVDGFLCMERLQHFFNCFFCLVVKDVENKALAGHSFPVSAAASRAFPLGRA